MSSAYRDLLDRTRATIREVDPLEATRLREAGALVLDVREPDEVEQGTIPGAVHIPRGFLEMRIEDAVRDKGRPVVVYCASGVRSAFAAKALQDLGFGEVASLTGGFAAWKGAGLPWGVPRLLSPDQRRRYSRHLLIPEVGEEGQRRLLDAKALLVGAG